jgi:hypothetical protein
VQRILEYLNAEMERVEVFGLELQVFGEGDDQLVLVPEGLFLATGASPFPFALYLSGYASRSRKGKISSDEAMEELDDAPRVSAINISVDDQAPAVVGEGPPIGRRGKGR